MKKLIIAIVAISALGSAVFAGEMKKEGSVMLGYSMAGGEAGKISGGGLALGFGFEGYKINDMFSVGGEFMYTSGSDTWDPYNNAAVTADYTTSTWGLLPYIKYSKEIDMGGNKADLYGLFGMGLYGVSIKAEFPAAYAAYNLDNGGETQFGFNLGGGMMFPMGDKMKIGGDVRYYIVASNLSYIVPSAKFTMSF